MSRIDFWNPHVIDKEIIHNAMKRLEKAAEVVAKKARSAPCVNRSTVTRPMYKTGRYKGQFWTARDAGALKRSIRVVREYGDEMGGYIELGHDNLNIRVYAGTKKVYYAQIVEFYTPFMRPALNASISKINRIMSNG